MNEARTAKVGEKKLLILQTIAEMLERPAADKVTTALLAKQLQVSEAALYRHFASKAQMYEGLIEFIETGVFSVITQIEAAEETGLKQAEAIVASLLRFAQKNRGLTRVLVGDALVHENPRLQARINQLLDRIEATLKQCLKIAHRLGVAILLSNPLTKGVHTRCGASAHDLAPKLWISGLNLEHQIGAVVISQVPGLRHNFPVKRSPFMVLRLH